MPHPTGDGNELADFLGGDEDLTGLNLDELNDRELDTGDKADEAQNYEDISDDDLPEEEEDALKPRPQAFVTEDLEDEGDDFDDLFGEGSGSPEDQRKPSASFGDGTSTLDQDDSPRTEIEEPDSEEEEEDSETREQRLLFEKAARKREARTGEESTGLPPAVLDDDLFYTTWPQFEPGRPPRFLELLPQKKAYYLAKTPLKPPKPIHPTKVNLDLEPDQEKAFRLPAGRPLPFEVRQLEAEARGIVLLAEQEQPQESGDDEDSIDLLDHEEGVGGVTWQDLVTLCEDWDIPSQAADSEDEQPILERDTHIDDLFLDDDFETLEDPRPAKRRRTGDRSTEPLRVLHNLNTLFEDPEKATAKLAKRVHLDLNDPYMLVDVQQAPVVAPQKRTLDAFKRDTTRGLTRNLTARYNISNDEAYDLLKQNHQNKIRAQVGNTPLEHATPAIRLQYPFYKQKLTTKERRRWHRPALHVTPGDVQFKKPASYKRKIMRTREVSENFVKTSDLTMGDNSSILLLEYSEESPPMLSTFGMGSRLINYYRRKDGEDTARPKLDIGETSVLLPQDKSPFDKFGNVDKGQVVPTLSNAMYRAPVFKHEAKPQDFLVSRSTTGLDGSVYVLRNIENLHAVGQQFPYVAVPGPKARAATNVSKFRLYMVAYRMYNKKHGKLSMDDVKRHNPDTDLPTIRTKMKEFMEFDKSGGQGRGVWKARREPPTEFEIRAMVKPDDVIMLYSMQVGEQHLRDAGYHRQGVDDAEEEEDDDLDDTSAGNLDRQLAPWNTTKNFLTACKGGAMLEIHGEGDPSGRGEALSMIRTSMKGGFRAIGQSVEDRLNSGQTGGHKYNVARQNQEYTDAIRRVWETQARALSTVDTHDDRDMDGAEAGFPGTRAGTPDSTMPRGRQDDESASMFSGGSGPGGSRKVLRITRDYQDKYGQWSTSSDIVRDPRIIREYQKRRAALDINQKSYVSLSRCGLDLSPGVDPKFRLEQFRPTGNKEQDAAMLRQFVLHLPLNTSILTVSQSQGGRVQIRSRPGRPYWTW